jgi:hypothetical protein
MSSFYQIASYAFRLHINLTGAQAFRAALSRVFRFFAVPALPQTALAPASPFTKSLRYGELHSQPTAGGHDLEIHLDARALHVPAVRLVDIFEPEIINRAAHASPPHLWIHGACLVRDGQLTLLVAQTGTGKTTLSLGLLRHGYQLITDDIILFDLAAQTIQPFPRCPKHRPGALEQLRSVGFDLTHEADFLGRYVLLPDRYVWSQPMPGPIQRIFHLTHTPDRPPGPCALSFTDGLLALLPHSNLLAVDPDFTLAAALFADTEFVSLNLSDFPADLACIAH